MSFCSQSFKDVLKQHSTDKRDDYELLALILEIYNAHKKCQKTVAQRETAFSAVMVDTYKVLIQDKVARMPENISYMDLAMKLCVQELNAKKNLGAKRLSLDECGATGQTSRMHNISLPGLNSAMFGSPNNSFALASETTISAVPKSIASTPTAITTITTASVPPITTATISPAYMPGQSKPRGRPPGSKNVNYASLLPANSTNTASTPRLDPSTMSTLMSLYSNPTFMSTLSQFTDPAQLNAFLVEYFRLTNTANVSQLMTGLTGHSKYPTPTTAAPPVAKPPKAPKPPSSSSSVSILPSNYTNKSIATVPSMTANTVSVSAANTYKSGASTVISVGSGQLTITPSLTITPNPSQPSAIPTTKPRKSADMKRKSNTTVLAQQKKLCTDLSSANMNLPRDLPTSLSIIPTISGMTNKPIPNLKPVVTMQPDKATKANKPKKKPVATNFPTSASFGGLSMAGITSDLISKYAELMRNSANTNSSSFLSQYEQFCSMVPPGLAAQPSLLKSKMNASTKAKPSGNGQAQQGMISVKHLESLQNKKPSKPTPKSLPAFQMLPVTSKPSQSTSTGSVLNPYAMPHGSLTHSPYLNATMMPTSVPSTLQIR